MADFFRIREHSSRKDKGSCSIYPVFSVSNSKDLLIKGKSFYAVWDEEEQLWSTNLLRVPEMVDNELRKYLNDNAERLDEKSVDVRWTKDFSSRSWQDFLNFVKTMPDSRETLDNKLIFANTKVSRSDYASKRLPYPLEPGDYSAYDELIGTLYSPEEREKLEWAIGSIFSGDSKKIQKFIVLYGEAGAGKSTILNIIQKLFDGYYTVFDAKSLTSSSNQFSTEVFKSNPLVAVQHDGDLSKIEDNTKLNSIVSHEEIIINEKYKSGYLMTLNCFLFMATNKPVKITDAKSGILRRLIDVSPSGNRLEPDRYFQLMGQIDFQLGAIASHCLEVYKKLGPHYYDSYRPLQMAFKTDVFFNFVSDNFETFSDGVSLKRSYDLYKEYCDDNLIKFKLPQYQFREELKNYFNSFSERKMVNGVAYRNYYEGLIYEKFVNDEFKANCNGESKSLLGLNCTESIFDKLNSECKAQYTKSDGTPLLKWADVDTKLSDIDTHRLHYVKLPSNHIVIDFDLKDSFGEKSLALNEEAASKWPLTYSEVSKSGKGIHLHYIYDGDVSKLSRVYSEGIEIKVFTGNSSLRRKFSVCNSEPIRTISTGLPVKEEKVINFEAVKNEKMLRSLILKNLNKEIHPATKPSVDFINKLLEDAYNSGMNYDVTDLRPKILTFALGSTNQATACVKLVNGMHFCSDKPSEPSRDEAPIVFFDVEVFPNLFLVNWKYAGEDQKCVRMINPTPEDIENLLKVRLIGFNCRRYDNHILYARYLGYSNFELYTLSQKIVSGSKNCMFGEAYGISYADVYDFSSTKQSLKKFEIELGIHHQELGLPWDEPVSEDKWVMVAEYCDNDVIATEAVFNARHADFIAREILADLSGLTVNDTTQQHAAKIIFGNDPHPQEKFVYTDLSEMFPGYTFDAGKSTYRGEEPGEGGYVYAEPGIYTNVALLDVASMHPSSIENLNLFGEYTKNFSQLKKARIAIKHKDFESAKRMLNGILTKYLTEEYASDLAYALKIVINIVYGMTSAKFDNKFKDSRNVDNIVAKRGALFMIDLKHAVQEKGFTVAHIKTDSIKIPDATPEIIEFVMEFGKKYGYIFEHEATYEKLCLVNDAVYVAKSIDGHWTATGTQFQVPYVFKTLFSKEPIVFSDLCETKTVSTALYLDLNEQLPFDPDIDKELQVREKGTQKGNSKFSDISTDELKKLSSESHNYVFVGKAGCFCPIKSGFGGGLLMREKDGKFSFATGAKGYRWLESEMVKNNGLEDSIDYSYFNSLVDDAISAIGTFGDVEWFLEDSLPWE